MQYQTTAFLQIQESYDQWDQQTQLCPPRHAPLPVFLFESNSGAEEMFEIPMADLCWPIGSLQFLEDLSGNNVKQMSRDSNQEAKGIPVFGSRVFLNGLLMSLHSTQVIKGHDEFCVQVGLLGNVDPSQCRAMLIYDVGSYAPGTYLSSSCNDPLPHLKPCFNECCRAIDVFAKDEIHDMGRGPIKHLSQTFIVCQTLLLDQVPVFDYGQFRALDSKHYEENLQLYRDSTDKKDEGDQRPNPPSCDRSDSQVA